VNFIADENIDGIIVKFLLLRLFGLPPQGKAETVLAVVDEHRDELLGNFTVVTPGIVRIRRSIP
jgi:hypothetical protein